MVRTGGVEGTALHKKTKPSPGAVKTETALRQGLGQRDEFSKTPSRRSVIPGERD